MAYCTSAGYTATEAQNRAISYLTASGLNGTVRTCGGAIVKNSMCAQMTTQTVTVAGSTPAKTVDQVRVIVEYDHEYSFVGPIMNLFGSGLGTHPAPIRQHHAQRVAAKVKGEER